MSKAKLITGLFSNRVAAEAAVDTLIKRGYHRDDISVLMSDATRNKEFACRLAVMPRMAQALAVRLAVPLVLYWRPSWQSALL